LITDSSKSPTVIVHTLAPNACVRQGDGTYVRLGPALEQFEYIRGHFTVDASADPVIVTGGAIRGIGPPRKVIIPALAQGSQEVFATRQGCEARAGLVYRQAATAKGGPRIAIYLSPDPGENEALLKNLTAPQSPLTSAPPVLPGVDASRGSGLASGGERAISDILTRLGIAHELQYSIQNPVPFGLPYRADFFLPNQRLVVEYDGESHFPQRGNSRSVVIPLVERDVYKALRLLELRIGVLRVSKSGLRQLSTATSSSLAEIAEKSVQSRLPAYFPDGPEYAAHRACHAAAAADRTKWIIANMASIIDQPTQPALPLTVVRREPSGCVVA
jgi:very-short-patch-repair endonuclease